jgi:hypothetical protein
LIVSISTIRDGRFHDPTCIFEPGEHRRITAQSWANFRMSRAVLSRVLIKGEGAWLYRADVPVSDAILEKLCIGLLESDHTPLRLKRYFEGKASAF